MKTDVQTRANSVPSDAVASTIRPSDGHTGRVVKTKKERLVDRVPFSDLVGCSQICHDWYLKAEASASSMCTPHLHFPGNS